VKRKSVEGVELEDFCRFMDMTVAKPGFSLFDGNWDESLSESEFWTTLLSIARERKALRTALNDAEGAIDKLDTAVSGLLFLILPISYMTIFGVDPNKVIVTLSSFLLAIAFAIGNTAKTLLESVIFLFVSHPFDIGDRIVFDGTFYTVSQMNLLTTRLKRYDNTVVYGRT
jgi:small-conductance mechanosensitive channel